VIHIADWYPTFIKLAGGDPLDLLAQQSGLPAVDGVDMWPLITGEVSQSPRTEIFVSEQVLIQYPFKLFLGNKFSWNFWTSPIYPNATTSNLVMPTPLHCNTGCIFNILSDPLETTPITNRPQIIQKMIDRLQQLSLNIIPHVSMRNGVDMYTNNAPRFYKNNSLTTADSVCLISAQIYGGVYGPYLGITQKFLDKVKLKIQKDKLEAAAT